MLTIKTHWRRMRLMARQEADLYFSRPVLINLCKDGTITYRTVSQAPFNGAALPVFTVDTVEDAQALQVAFGKLQYTRHPLMSGKTPWYRLHPFSGNVDDLQDVTMRFFDWYESYKRIVPRAR